MARHLLSLLILSALMIPSGEASVKGNFVEMTPAELMKVNGRKTPFAPMSGGVTFSINLVYEESDYLPKNFYVYNENAFIGGYVTSYDPEGKCVVLEDMEPGVYTVMGSFDELISHPGNPWTKCYVFLEDVEVAGDTEVSVVASTAVNQFIGASYLPDGELARVDNNGYDENMEPLFVPGNCRDKLIQTTIFDEKYNAWIVSAVGNTGTYAMDNIYGPGIHWRPEEMYNIMVNDISDRFVVCQQRDNYLENGMASTVAYSRGVSNLDLSNDIANYRRVEEKFAHTLAFDMYGSPDEHYQYTGLGYEGFSYFPYSMLPWKMDNPFAIDYSTSANSGDFDAYHPYYRFQLYDANVEWNEFYLKGQRFTFDEEGAYYIFSNFFSPSEISGTRAVDSDGEEVYYEFPGHPGLQVNASPSIDYINGNCAPLNTMSPMIYKNGESFITNLNPVFKGLLGEERESDKIGLYATVLHNGEDLAIGGEDWNSFWNQAPNDDPSGVYGAQIENDVNVMVDGIKGYNFTTLSFCYEKADMCPPALQALQFRNSDNIFAQRFDDASDVRIIVCAGDYDWWETEDYLEYNYASKAVTVKVEVAPHVASKDQIWTEIEMENRADYNNLAGYGYFFEGSLVGIELQENKGWFDIRVTAVDESGNSNVQVLGPAFLVGESVGVDTASVGAAQTGIVYADGVVRTVDGSEADYVVYSTDGRRLLAGRGASLDVSALSGGMYVVTALTRGDRVSLKIAI